MQSQPGKDKPEGEMTLTLKYDEHGLIPGHCAGCG